MSIKLITLLLLCTSSSFAFQDSDLDGVEDTLDRCPNSSFDELVDQKGCAKNQTQKIDLGTLTLRINNDFYTDSTYGDDHSLNLFTYYRYHAWSLSLSNYQNNTDSSYSDGTLADTNDLYLTVGYLKSFSQATLQFSVGTRFISDVDVTTTQSIGGKGRFDRNATQVTQTETLEQKNDYYTGINLHYLLANKQSLFGYLGYTLSGNEENYVSFSIGTGRSINGKLYTSLSYHYAQASFSEGEDQQSLSWFNSYSFTPSVFGTLNYSYGLNNLAYDHSLSLGLGISFQ